MLFYAMLHWALFVADEGDKAQTIFYLFYKPFRNGLTLVVKIKLVCGYVRTQNSQIEFECSD